MAIFKLGELFSGAGGITLGALNAAIEHNGEQFGVIHQWANDYNEDTCATYRRNICPDAKQSVICSDVRELEIEKLAPIDALAFGFPCNDFSIVGEKKGIVGHYGPLYTYGVRALRHFKPKWFLAENVVGLKNANDGNAFSTIISELEASGYRVVPHYYWFEKYGVPQKRHRIIIVGIRDDLDITFKVPAPLPGPLISSGDAISNPPIMTGAFNNDLTRQHRKVIERLKHIRPGENAFTAHLPDHLKLNVRGAKISQIYKRLDPGKPAYTVTASGGGGTHIYHWTEPRALTNRERARLQTFPDHYKFIGARESVRRQIGMAVPPKAAQLIVEAVLKSFAGIDYPSIPANIDLQQVATSALKVAEADDLLP